MKYHHHKNIVIIVSAYSSGVQLAPLFRGRGYPCIHLTTTREWNIKRLRSMFCEKDFVENFVIDSEEQLTTILKRLQKNHCVKAVIPGCESGVTLADSVSQYFDVPKNDFNLSQARRNKFLMIEAIKQHGLMHARQLKSQHLQEILQWAETIYSQQLDFRRGANRDEHRSLHEVNEDANEVCNNAKNSSAKSIACEKIVLKPLSSSSSDSVFYCRTPQEITHAFETIHGARDMYSEINHEVLAQEYIDGDEYIVNTVSSNGQHFVVDIWRGVSEDKTIVSNDSYADLVHPNDPAHAALSNYVIKVLDALGIHHGPAHSEIKLSSQGPCLIETGARLAGKVDFASVEEIFGYSQASLTAEAMLEPTRFQQRINTISMPTKHARYVYFATNHEGLILHEPDLSEFMEIESIASIKYALKLGEQLRKTSKTFRSPRPGYAYLAADSAEKINSDYLLLRRAETNLYAAITRNVSPANESLENEQVQKVES